jgi:uncharacterized protein YqkB
MIRRNYSEINRFKQDVRVNLLEKAEMVAQRTEGVTVSESGDTIFLSSETSTPEEILDPKMRPLSDELKKEIGGF